ncbi:hypothetical protein [Bifidobacterium crudilactis]|uniref:hypothetical protein n=1 Tax=Bifidobacterium crudilactis TaxID=327277 RepID=UPI00235488C0|nr:hypothetical protein [Bifidobacterium crudilactis]MCI2158474.1 hypothetical protein [Bifidobacterium crudilactis]
MALSYSLVGVSELDSLSDQKIVQNLKSQMRDFECLDTRTVKRFITTENVYIAEDHGESRTYLAINEDDNSMIGFFTLGLTSVKWEKITCSEGWSALSKKKQAKYSKGVRQSTDGYVGVYTIGELARSSRFTHEDFPGTVLLREAISQVMRAREISGGRFLLVDSLQHLYDALYSKAGFIRIGDLEAPDEDDEAQYCVSILTLENLL